MNRKIRILFVHHFNKTYIQEDLKILQRHFDVKSILWTRTRDLKKVFTVAKHIYKTDLVFIWFAGKHAAYTILFSKLFGKKSVVVVGGYEVAHVPEINYGLMISPKSARMVKFVLKNADKVLPVSKFHENEVLKYGTSDNIISVYNGVDCDIFKPKSNKKDSVRDDLVIFVGGISERYIKIKGIETFVRSAKYLPHVQFVVAGEYFDDSMEYLSSIATQNVEFLGHVPHEDLPKWYQKAKVYCQLSLFESFGLPLAEAMSCGCVPVVTNNAALPEVVGDTGFYVPYGDSKATAEAIREALKSDKGKEARERIKNMFSIEQRETELINIIEEIMDNI